MRKWNREQIVRLAIVFGILLSGAAMIPFADLPAAAIGWESLAGVYEPQLSANETMGAAGSRFAFTGTNYPSNTAATVYLDGDPLGQIDVAADGTAAFILDTAGAVHRQYNVTLEVDVNASATQGIELVEDAPIVDPPSGFQGTTIETGHPTFLPTLFR